MTATTTTTEPAQRLQHKSSKWSLTIIILKVLALVPGFIWSASSEGLRRVIHRWTYKSPSDIFRLLDGVPEPGAHDDDAPSTCNIVILGGSQAGSIAARALGGKIPSGWRIVVVEQNDTYQHLWNFPRYTALPPDPVRAARAFVPFDGHKAACPAGALEWVTAEAVRAVAAGEGKGDGVRGYIELAGGKAVPYHFLLVATGADSSRLEARTKEAGCAELAKRAEAVAAAKRIVVLGGGAVGVELATDIRSHYGDEKTVTLIHSHDRLLDRFGLELHAAAMAKCTELGVRVVLGERPEGGVDMESGEIALPGTGEEIEYDLFVKCTGGGSHKASSMLRTLLPESSFNARDGRLRTSAAMQVVDSAHGEVFALGDVSDPDVPGVSKMGRAAMFQAACVAENIVRLIRHEGQEGAPRLQAYAPLLGEDSIKLTLGLHDACMWMHAGELEFSWMTRLKDLDLDARRIWAHFGVGGQYPGTEPRPEA